MSEKSSGFDNLKLSKPLLEGLKTNKFEHPTPIQLAAIPEILAGHNFIGQAQTGTGKTLAFALPLLQRIDLKLDKTQILVLTPTRELALQVAEAFVNYACNLPHCRITAIYGGSGYVQQKVALKKQPHVIVATTGRLLDHMRQGTFSTRSLKAIVLDEADEMLRIGFLEDIDHILKSTQQNAQKCQIALFSATMPKPIQALAKRYLNDHKSAHITNSKTTASTIAQHFITISRQTKLDALIRVIEAEVTDGVIIFVRTRSTAQELSDALRKTGFSSTTLNGELSQRERERVVQAFKAQKYDIIVATNVAARGLDIDRVSTVINYDFSADEEWYIHRIGRTGRAGKSGKAITFVTRSEQGQLRRIEKRYDVTINSMAVPDRDTIRELRISKLGEQLSKSLQSKSLSDMKEVGQRLCQQLNIDNEQLTELLLHQLQKNKPFEPTEMKRPSFSTIQLKNHDKFSSGKKHFEKKSGSKPTKRSRKKSEILMKKYKLDIGRKHNVKVGNIVGAIANEADIDNHHIGDIRLFTDYTLIDLPDGMPKETFNHLKKTRVCGRSLNITEA